MTRHMQFVLSMGLACVLAAPAFAETHRVPQDFATIQAAVDAADEGDTILVSRGTYTEKVVIAGKHDLRIIGRGAVWDGSGGGVEGSQLIAASDDLLIQGFTFRHGQVQVGIFGDRAMVKRCRSTGASMHFVLIQGRSGPASGSSVENCRVTDAQGPAVKIHGDDTSVVRCTFDGMKVMGILLSGDDAVVERCTVLGANVHGLVVEGQRALVQRNRVDGARIKGIVVHGGAAEILRNRVSNGAAVAGIEQQHGVRTDFSDNGPFFDGGRIEGNRVSAVKGSGIRSHFASDVRIVRNRVSGGGQFGIACSTHAAVIERNAIRAYSAIGILLLADDGEVTRNRILSSGFGCDPAVHVQGDRNALERNSVKAFGGDGFWVFGDANDLIRNTAARCTEDGFDIQGGNGNRLDDCVAIACGAEGLDNSGTGTEVSGGRFQRNLIDVVNDGTFAALVATFGTGDASTAPQVDCSASQRQEFRLRTVVGVSRPTFDSRGATNEPSFDDDLSVISLPGP